MHLNGGIVLDCIAMHWRACMNRPVRLMPFQQMGLQIYFQDKCRMKVLQTFLIGRHAGKARKSPTKNIAEILMTTK